MAINPEKPASAMTNLATNRFFLCIQILNNADEVVMEGGDRGELESVHEELRSGWFVDDFQKYLSLRYFYS